MAVIRCFEELEAWKKARELTRLVYGLTKQREFSSDPDLRRQLRRAAVSVMANIAEGFERSGSAEFINFLSIAKGSVGEVESHLFVALDERFMTTEQFSDARTVCGSSKRLIAGIAPLFAKLGQTGCEISA